MKPRMPNIFQYLDFRRYLDDAFRALRSHEGGLSYREFARRAGYRSPNLFQLVLAGRRRLNRAAAMGTARALGLKAREQDFFETLVAFGQADFHAERDAFYQKLLRFKEHRAARLLDTHQYEYGSNWYNPVVRELLIHPAHDGTAEWIAERISPSVTVTQVEKSIELLVKLGLVARDPATGRWRQTSSTVSTPRGVRTLAAANLLRSGIDLAAEALESVPPEQRDMRSVILGVSFEAYEEIRTRFRAFWEELLQFVSTQDRPETVCQINMQLFPLVKEKGPHDD